MKKSLKYREALTDVRRVVVKIGSRVLVQKSGRPDMRRMRALIHISGGSHTNGPSYCQPSSLELQSAWSVPHTRRSVGRLCVVAAIQTGLLMANSAQ